MNLKKSLLATQNIVFFLIGLFVLICIIVFYIKGRSDPVSDAVSKTKELTVVIVVYDQNKPILTALYAHDISTKRGAIFDIPANVGVTLAKLDRVDRIGAAFDKSRPEDYAQEVAGLTGVAPKPFYISISMDNLSYLVDLVGGVEVFVANSIFKRAADGSIISLPSGSVTLDGAKAREFLSIQDDQESSARWVERRQKFLQALLRKLSKSGDVMSNRYASDRIASFFDTDMQSGGLKMFFKYLSDLDTNDMIIQKVSGPIRIVDDKQLTFPHYDGRLLQETVKQTLTSLKNAEATAIDIWPRKVEIQNGTPQNGLAGRTSQIFESMGYQVAAIGNAPTTDVAYTVVLDMANNPEAAQKVAAVIRCVRVYSISTDNEDDANHADIRIILGKDFDGRYCQQVSTSDAE